MPDEEPLDRGQDFATLMSEPTNKDTQFMLKSDKNWNQDISRYSDSFVINIAILNAGIRCIPFSECIDLAEEYFTVRHFFHSAPLQLRLTMSIFSERSADKDAQWDGRGKARVQIPRW